MIVRLGVAISERNEEAEKANKEKNLKEYLVRVIQLQVHITNKAFTGVRVISRGSFMVLM